MDHRTRALLVKPEFRDEMTALRQIERLGYDPHAVRHIVLTHLDFDRAGGLDDFTWATVHVSARELDYAERHVPAEALRGENFPLHAAGA